MTHIPYEYDEEAVKEFMGEDYEKGETFIPHSQNQPLREAPAREGSQGDGQHTNRKE